METIFVQTVWRIMEELRDANQLEEALQTSLDILCESISCERGSIWMIDDQSGRVIDVITSGSATGVGASVPLGEGVVGRVAGSGNAEIYPSNESADVDIAGEDGPKAEGHGLLCVALKTHIHSIGCLLLAGKSEGEFTDKDREICENCCAVVALDIEDKGFSFRPFEDRDPVISVRDVVKEYMNGEEIRQVLKGVTLDIFPGELMVVLGESGCGKSTLLNIIGGMDTMSSGEIMIEGKDMSHPTEEELTEFRRKYVGFIFQAYNLMPNLSAIENVEFIGEISEDPMDSMEALRLVELADKADNLPAALSGGQMQRVSIARALVKDPKIILADEPTAALDYETSIKVLSVIENIAKERRTTVIMVTHNPEIAKMANRVIKLRDGKISSVRVNLHPLSANELVW